MTCSSRFTTSSLRLLSSLHHIPHRLPKYYHHSNKITTYRRIYYLNRTTRAFSIMPPKGIKRKAEPIDGTPARKSTRTFTTKKAPETNGESSAQAAARRPDANESIDRDEIVLRQFYPPEMSSQRVQDYKNGVIPTPYDELMSALNDTSSQRVDIKPNKAIAHWFRWDLRLNDNTALHRAYESAKSHQLPLICLFVFSHDNFHAHYTSPARIDFALRSLKILKADLAKLDIPLWVEEVTDRKHTQKHIFDWCEKWGVSEVHANIEYEVDELRRDAKLLRAGIKKDLAFHFYHDTTVVEPTVLRSGSGKTYAVFTPFFKSWEPYVYKNGCIDHLFPPPSKNDPKLKAKDTFKDLFAQSSFPTPREEKRLSEKDAQRLAKLWPAGEHEAKARLSVFLDRISKYAESRDRPDIEGGTSGLSVHFAAGTLSARQAFRTVVDHSPGKSLAAGHHGWIRELCFRDFYKTILVTNPHVCMNKAYHEEYHNVEWEYNDEQFQRWVEGKTGYPIVDAAMRQLASNKYMHNRCRMIVASFLCKDLLLDWRKGERYFMEQLIDGDFASNNAGWQFCSSSGTDAQPYFRIFNPLTQSEKFDPSGDYIRRWVPELSNLTGKAIHEPKARLSAAEFKKLGYPDPIIEHKFARERALERYKTGLGRNTR
ncbi:Cryptochrome-2 [Arthrobotrys entomopaga]|nr:Cryptochrome-2 [Arthrobotrys entomopaga]